MSSVGLFVYERRRGGVQRQFAVSIEYRVLDRHQQRRAAKGSSQQTLGLSMFVLVGNGSLESSNDNHHRRKQQYRFAAVFQRRQPIHRISPRLRQVGFDSQLPRSQSMRRFGATVLDDDQTYQLGTGRTADQEPMAQRVH